MKKLRSLMVAVMVVFAASSAMALDLQAARAQGLVGEQTDGYVAAIKSTPEVQTLVTTVNSQRRTEYDRISKQNGQPMDIVAKLAAAQILQKLAPGSLYQGASGGWVKK